MDLTTLALVKARLTPTANSPAAAGNDALLTSLITSVSDGIERYLGRSIQTAARTQYADVIAGQSLVRLDAWPVTSITSVSYDPTHTSWVTFTAGTDYLSPVTTAGEFLEMLWPFSCDARKALRIIYTGGMGATTAAFIAAYPELSSACEMQVIHEFQRRMDRGLISVAGDIGTASLHTGAFIPAVIEILNRYRSHYAP